MRWRGILKGLSEDGGRAIPRKHECPSFQVQACVLATTTSQPCSFNKITADKLFSEIDKKKYFPAEIFRISLAFAFIFTNLYGVATVYATKTTN
jgi:hypothetical protein